MSKSPKLSVVVASLMAAATAASAQPAPGVAPPPPPARGPSTALALEAAQAALAVCAANGYKVSITVLDSAGVLKVVLAGDGVRPMGVTSSARKAAAVLMFKTSSAALDEAQKTDAELAARIKADPTIMARAGGQPLMSGAELIGAIGVGGAPGGEKDDVCALAGVAKVKGRL